MSNEKNERVCSNEGECSCPNSDCKNHGICCQCVKYHRETGSPPLCIMPGAKK